MVELPWPSPAALTAWAAAHGVADLPRAPLRELARRTPAATAIIRCFGYASGLTLVDALFAQARFPDAALPEWRRALAALVEDEAAARARGLAHEATLRASFAARGPSTADGVLRPLMALREQLRAGAAPADPVDLSPARRLRFALGGRAPTATLELPEGRAGERAKVRVDLAAPRAAVCSLHPAAPCAHALAALDELLRYLLREPAPKELAQLAREAEVPAWARALDALEALGEARADDAELAWWVRLPMVSGHVPVAPVLRRRGKRGEWLSPKATRASAVLADGAALDDADRRIAELLEVVERSSGASAAASALVIEALVGHPRVWVGPAVERAEPWSVEIAEARVRVTRERDQARARLVVEGQALAGLDAREVLADAERRRLVVARISRATRVAFERVSEALHKLGADELPALAARLARLDPALGVDVDEVVPIERHAARDAWTLRLAARDDGGLEGTLVVQPLDGGPYYRAGQPPARVMAPLGGDRLVATLRDLEAERAGVRARWEAWGAGPSDDPHRLFVGHQQALPLLAGVRDDPRGTQVEWSGAPIRVLPRVRPRQLRLALTSGPDWLAVEGEAAVEEHRATLAMLLDAARGHSRFVRVDGESWLELEDEVAERIRALEPYVRHVGDRLEVPALALPVVADALGDVRGPPEWSALVHRARAAADASFEPPDTLRAELRPYQREGFTWMARLAAWGAGALLADDMGLGKTVQAIAVLLHRAADGPALVLAPTSVTYNWRRELARFAPTLRVRGLRDTAPPAAGEVVVTSYGLALTERDALLEQAFATLIVDEAQVIKNPTSQRSQLVRALRASWRVALTGTPIENHLGDLWAIFAAVAPGLLGSWDHFRDRWVGVRGPALDGLRRVVRPFVLRRTKADVLTELPPKTEVVIDVALSPAERALYDDARLAAVAELRRLGEALRSPEHRFHVLAALTRLRQLACDASLVIEGDAPPSSKLARFAELTASLIDEGHSVIAFSQFTALLDRAEAALTVPHLRLDGSTPAAERAATVDRFQRGAPAVLLVSLKAGGTGLNLTAADHVFHLDPWWNPAAEDQATDRAHRIGQARPVTVFRMVARDTIEAAIVELHGDKRRLAAQLIDGDGPATLEPDALIALIEDGAEAERSPPPEPEARPRRRIPLGLHGRGARRRGDKSGSR